MSCHSFILELRNPQPQNETVTKHYYLGKNSGCLARERRYSPRLRRCTVRFSSSTARQRAGVPLHVV
jgi:hypothetical protein